MLEHCANEECDKKTRSPDIRNGLCAKCWNSSSEGREESRSKRKSRPNLANILSSLHEDINKILEAITQTSSTSEHDTDIDE